eukprot:scaffold1058_cov163-Amphora_coffeaeformis.AAC.4
MEASPSSSSTDDLPVMEYEALDLSFDDIPPIEANSDPTEFAKPGKVPSADPGVDDALDGEAYILGTLLVRIVAARNLPAVRGGNVLQKLIPGQAGTTNAYASVRFGTTTQRTTVVRGTADPLWPRQEFLYMDVIHPVLEDPMPCSNGGEDGNIRGKDSVPSAPPAGDPPTKKKAPPTVAKVPLKKPPPITASSNSSVSSTHRSTSLSSLRNSTLEQQRQLPQLDPPVLTIALFHATHEPQKYNPSKNQQQRGDSDDVFLGMTSMDVTTLLTGKDRCFDDWWRLQGGPDNNDNNSSSVRVVVEYEPSDTAPRPGDLVKFTRYCHTADLYPFSPYVAYEVQSVDGDDVTIGATSPEGWCTSAIVRRHALVCQERQLSVTERIMPHWATLGERLGQSPLVQTLQTGVSRVPDEGLVSVAQDVLTNGQGLLARWWQGGLGTALEDVRHATNWDGETLPTAEESLELAMPPSIEEEEAAVIPVEDENDIDDNDTDRSILPNMPVCPISQEPMKDPVVAADGHTYERSAIARWLATSDKSPLTGAILPHKELVPNYMLLSSLREAAVASAPTPTSSNTNLLSVVSAHQNDNGAAPNPDDNSNDPPSLIDEDDADLREEQL